VSTFIKVNPSEIQKELDRLEEAHKENKQQRACLFNLILYSINPDRLPYFQELVDQISKQFPCRIIVIQEDPDNQSGSITTSLAVKVLDAGSDKQIICEEIHLEIPASILEQSYPLILPHIIPDLPIYLIWAGDPTSNHPLFTPFRELAHRLIFESECTANLSDFCKKIQMNILNQHWEVADLNWVRSESWRKALKSIFNSEDRLEELLQTEKITLRFSEAEDTSLCYNHFQVHYLHGWLAAQLKWEPVSFKDHDSYKTILYKQGSNSIEVEVHKEKEPSSKEGNQITYAQIKTRNKKIFTCSLNPKEGMIKIDILDEKNPKEAYNTYLMHAKWEHTLSKEICYQETSAHYCNTLSILSNIEGLL